MVKRKEGRLWEAWQPILTRWDMDPVRVENGLDFGTPDVNYSQGWAELKYASAPVNFNRSPVDIEWQKGQKGFLARRWSSGGNAFLMLQVGENYLLIDGWSCVKLTDKETLPQLIDISLVSSGDLSYKDFRLILRADPSEMPNYLRARWYRARSKLDRLAAATSLNMTVDRVAAGESGVDARAAEDLVEAWEV